MFRLKKIIALMSAAATAALAAAQMPAVCAIDLSDPTLEPEFVEFATRFGDVNFDRLVGVSDAVQLLRFLLGETDELGNWWNADLNQDGVINVHDFTLLKQQISGHGSTGGTILVNVVDMMTGEPLEGGSLSMWCEHDGYGYDIGDWTNSADAVACFTGLPTDQKYTYYLDISNVPKGYGNEFDNYIDRQMAFTFGLDETNKVVNYRLIANDVPCNVKLHQYDWAMEMDVVDKLNYGYGRIVITDKSGDIFYYAARDKECALPDGEYHAQMVPYSYPEPYPVRLLRPDSDFAKHMQEIYPDLEFEDKSGGIDFTVKDGVADKEITFDFQPVPGATNYITVNCIDGMTNQPLEGVEISLIEAPDTYAKKVATWVSDSTGTHTFDHLWHSGYAYTHAYKVVVEGMPAGYGCGMTEDYVCAGYVNSYTQTLTFYFGELDSPKLVSADIIQFEDQSVVNDITTYEIWKTNPDNSLNSDKIYVNVKPGEKFALPDGSYFAVLNYPGLKENGVRGIRFDDPKDKAYIGDTEFTHADYLGDTSFILFNVKDGKPDKDLKFYVMKDDTAEQ